MSYLSSCCLVTKLLTTVLSRFQVCVVVVNVPACNSQDHSQKLLVLTELCRQKPPCRRHRLLQRNGIVPQPRQSRSSTAASKVGGKSSVYKLVCGNLVHWSCDGQPASRLAVRLAKKATGRICLDLLWWRGEDTPCSPHVTMRSRLNELVILQQQIASNFALYCTHMCDLWVLQATYPCTSSIAGSYEQAYSLSRLPLRQSAGGFLPPEQPACGSCMSDPPFAHSSSHDRSNVED